MVGLFKCLGALLFFTMWWCVSGSTYETACGSWDDANYEDPMYFFTDGTLGSGVLQFSPAIDTSGLDFYESNLPGGLSFAGDGEMSGTIGDTGAATGQTLSVDIECNGDVEQTVTTTFQPMVCPTLSYAESTIIVTVGEAVSVTANVSPTAMLAHTIFAASPALPLGISLTVASGDVSGTPLAAFTSATVVDILPVPAIDCDVPSSAVTLTFKHRCSGMDYNTVFGGTYTVDTAISYTYTNPDAFTHTPSGWTAGTLPTGLSFNTGSGEISGTATTVGEWTVSVSVDHSAADCEEVTDYSTITGTFNIVPVCYGDVTMSYVTVEVLQNTVITSIHPTFAETDFSVALYPAVYFAADAVLPLGLQMDINTGEITGTPTTLGSSTATIYMGCEAATPGSVLVNFEVVTMSDCPTSGTVTYVDVGDEPGETFSATPTVVWSPVFFDHELTYGVSTGDLPDGAVIDPTSGAISGTITADTDHTVQVGVACDGNLVATSADFNMDVQYPDCPGAVTISYSDDTLTFNDTVDLSVTITPTTPVEFYQNTVFLVAAAVPGGVLLHPKTGRLFGQALDEPGTYEFDVILMCGLSTYTHSVTLVIEEPMCPLELDITYGDLAGELDVPLSLSPTLTSFPTQYSSHVLYFVTENALPVGLIVDVVTGEISGTPREMPSVAAEITGWCDDDQEPMLTPVVLVNDILWPACPQQATLEYDDAVFMTATSTALSLTANLTSSPESRDEFTYLVVDPIPAGVVIDATTGDFSGTPSEAFNATVEVFAVCGSLTVSYEVHLEVRAYVTCPAVEYDWFLVNMANKDTVSITPHALPAPLTLPGDVPTFALEGTLPQNLTLNTVTGEISGTTDVLSDDFPNPMNNFTMTTAAVWSASVCDNAVVAKEDFIITVQSITIPDAPDSVTVTTADESVSVVWTAPSYDGDTAVTSYTVTATPAHGPCGSGLVVSSGLSTTCTGLTNGVTYTVTVFATNIVGDGDTDSCVVR